MNIQKHRRNLLFVSLILSNFSFNLGTYIIIITPISFSKYFHVSSETVMSFTQIYGIISSVLSIPFSVLADAFNFYLPYRIASVAIFLGSIMRLVGMLKSNIYFMLQSQIWYSMGCGSVIVITAFSEGLVSKRWKLSITNMIEMAGVFGGLCAMILGRIISNFKVLVILSLLPGLIQFFFCCITTQVDDFLPEQRNNLEIIKKPELRAVVKRNLPVLSKSGKDRAGKTNWNFQTILAVLGYAFYKGLGPGSMLSMRYLLCFNDYSNYEIENFTIIYFIQSFSKLS